VDGRQELWDEREDFEVVMEQSRRCVERSMTLSPQVQRRQVCGGAAGRATFSVR
jgi:hypothetical protein